MRGEGDRQMNHITALLCCRKERTLCKREADSLLVNLWLYLRERVKSPVMEEGLRVEPLLLLIERIQLRWFRHLTKMPPGWGVLGSSYRNEAPGQTQGMLERLHLSWPENASMSPWIRWRSGYGEGGLDFLARAVAPTTDPCISSSWRMFYQRRRRQILYQLTNATLIRASKSK